MSDVGTDLSIVVPVFNEVESIDRLIGEINIQWVSGALPRRTEVIVVNDGSTDGTRAMLIASRRKYPELEIRLLELSRNFGQTQALALGFQQSRGKLVVALDGDGQNDPADIEPLIDFQRKTGVDCVSGWRSDRKGDNPLRVRFSRIANSLLMRASGVAIHDSGCTLKVYRGEVIRSVPLFGDMHRIIPFQIEVLGGTCAELAVSHRERTGGKSHYSLRRTFRVLQDIIVVFFIKRFMQRPMHLLGSLGLLVFFVGFLGLVVALVLKILGVFDFVETPALLISLVLGVGGLNMMGIGLIAEMLNRRNGSGNLLPHPWGWSEN